MCRHWKKQKPGAISDADLFLDVCFHLFVLSKSFSTLQAAAGGQARALSARLGLVLDEGGAQLLRDAEALDRRVILSRELIQDAALANVEWCPHLSHGFHRAIRRHKHLDATFDEEDETRGIALSLLNHDSPGLKGDWIHTSDNGALLIDRDVFQRAHFEYRQGRLDVHARSGRQRHLWNNLRALLRGVARTPTEDAKVETGSRAS